MNVVVRTDEEVRRRSTAAAQEYVRVVTHRLQMELARHGDDVRTRRSCQALERSISPEELARMWPHADVDKVLASTPRTPGPVASLNR